MDNKMKQKIAFNMLKEFEFELGLNDLAILEEELAWTNPDPWGEYENCFVVMKAMLSYSPHLVRTRIKEIKELSNAY